MCGIDVAQFKGIADDRQFTELLVQEQSVFCLPATVFNCPNYFRIVTTVRRFTRALPTTLAVTLTVHCDPSVSARSLMRFLDP